MALRIDSISDGRTGLLLRREESCSQRLRRFRDFLAEELRPFPGRERAALRLVIAASLVAVIVQTLRIPHPAFSIFIVFFLAEDSSSLSLKKGVLAMMVTTFVLGVAILISICFADAPWFRLLVTFGAFAAAVWLSRVVAMDVLGRLMAVVLVVYLSLADVIFDGEILTRQTLWLWSVVGIPVAVTLLVNGVMDPGRLARPAVASKGLWVKDAFSSPEHGHFAARVVMAVFTCDLFINAVEWPGIRTCLVTCAVLCLPNRDLIRSKAGLRLLGMTAGGLLGLFAVVYIVPHLDTIFGLLLLIAVGTYGCAWISAGSARISYAGIQMALAFYLMIMPGFDTSVDLTAIRDRFIGIFIGVTAMWFFVEKLPLFWEKNTLIATAPD